MNFCAKLMLIQSYYRVIITHYSWISWKIVQVKVTYMVLKVTHIERISANPYDRESENFEYK